LTRKEKIAILIKCRKEKRLPATEPRKNNTLKE